MFQDNEVPAWASGPRVPDEGSTSRGSSTHLYPLPPTPDCDGPHPVYLLGLTPRTGRRTYDLSGTGPDRNTVHFQRKSKTLSGLLFRGGRVGNLHVVTLRGRDKDSFVCKTGRSGPPSPHTRERRWFVRLFDGPTVQWGRKGKSVQGVGTEPDSSGDKREGGSDLGSFRSQRPGVDPGRRTPLS